MGEAHPQTTVVPRPYPFTNLSSHSQGSLMPGFVQELPRPPNPCIGGGFFLPPISAGKIDGQKKKGAKRKHLIVLLSRRQPSQKKVNHTPPLLSGSDSFFVSGRVVCFVSSFLGVHSIKTSWRVSWDQRRFIHVNLLRTRSYPNFFSPSLAWGDPYFLGWWVVSWVSLNSLTRSKPPNHIPSKTTPSTTPQRCVSPKSGRHTRRHHYGLLLPFSPLFSQVAPTQPALQCASRTGHLSSRM